MSLAYVTYEYFFNMLDRLDKRILDMEFKLKEQNEVIKCLKNTNQR